MQPPMTSRPTPHVRSTRFDHDQALHTIIRLSRQFPTSFTKSERTSISSIGRMHPHTMSGLHFSIITRLWDRHCVGPYPKHASL